MSVVLKQWREWRRDRSRYPGQNSFAGLLYCALGLGEAGEAAGEVKKAWRDDVPAHVRTACLTYESRNVLTDARRKKIILELGDVLWYIDAMCDELGISLDDVAIANVEKIDARVKAGGIVG